MVKYEIKVNAGNDCIEIKDIQSKTMSDAMVKTIFKLIPY